MAHASDIRVAGFDFSRFANLRETLATRFANYRTYRATLNELSDLSDRELADLGLARANIKSVAYQAAYGN
ncbi:DUF1127 domain-containing protein [Octadecabacter sp. R77987]|uniref:DUF1127 domain-containing protein n=1 Tax=Octadecabacter sp. R77987 TaxID=3093874 RepID=UPI00366F1939